MSVESLIFIAIFILLPLVERLLGNRRGKGQRPKAPPPPPPRPAPRERVPLPPRHGAEVPEASAPEPIRREIPAPLPVPAPAGGPVRRDTSANAEARHKPPPMRSRVPTTTVPPASRLPEAASRRIPEAPARRPLPVEQTMRRVPAIEARSLESLEGDLAVRPRPRPPAAPAPAQRRSTAAAVRRIVRNPVSLRRAVIAATVIGPCRANEDA